MVYILEGNSNKYILEKLLGEGATCKCYLGYEILSNQEKSEPFAIKIFNQRFYRYYSNEVDILSKLPKNDNIIKLYNHGKGLFYPSSSEDKDKKINSKEKEKNDKEEVFFEIMEYAINGELKDYVKGKSTRIPEKISAKIFKRIVLTVKDLHKNNIAHCDIKPENILVDKNFRLLLNDFGFSQIFDGEKGDYILHKFSGSNIYCAPETRKAYTKGFDAIKNDIFSLGVLLFVITIGNFPFINASFSDEKYRYIVKKNYERFWEFFSDIEISEEFKDLINKLISINPSQRLEIKQILEHPWLKKYDKQKNNDKNDRNEVEDDSIDEDIINEFKSRKV